MMMHKSRLLKNRNRNQNQRKMHQNVEVCVDERRKNDSEGYMMPNLRKRTLSAIMTLLFISLAMPGCLSLVIGRELMESTRGKPNIEQVDSPYDLSHTWQNITDPDDFHESKTILIPIDNMWKFNQ